MDTARPHPPRVIVVGAGIAGLTAGALLAREGCDVEVIEQSAHAGGKMRPVPVGSQVLDGGPTVLTMRWVFEALFDALGRSFTADVPLERCKVLARHAWGAGERLDLLADLEASVEAIARFSSTDEALRYRAFCRRSAEVYRTLEQSFIAGSRPTPWSLAARVGWRQWPQLARISPFETCWGALGRHFRDPRLRQLFGRYATYCGSSPFAAPATLMLVAHVERAGVWRLPHGMRSLAQALAHAGRQHGMRLRCGRRVDALLTDRRGRIDGVALAGGERLPADAVVFNGDASALASGALGAAAQAAVGAPTAPAARSLSALTWHLEASVEGFDPSLHNVFFSDPRDEGYRREFDDLAAGRLPAEPTVYLCAQDRDAEQPRAAAERANGAPERLMLLVNAPATADHRPLGERELASCEQKTWSRLAQAGLRLKPGPTPMVRTTPQDFAQWYPATGGALYGAASHGWQASFRRPGSTTRLPGLILAGGSVHPGPGVPMAALSGRQAALHLIEALRSTRRCHPVATPGGTSTP